VKAGKLVRVLEPFAPMAPGVFLYYPGYRQMMPKLRAFIDHVKSRSDTANKTLIHIDDGGYPRRENALTWGSADSSVALGPDQRHADQAARKHDDAADHEAGIEAGERRRRRLDNGCPCI